MTPTSILLVTLIALVVLFALKTSFGKTRLDRASSPPQPMPPEKTPLRVLQPRCENCVEFSVKAAKTIFRQNGAFEQVMEHLEPWQYFNPPHRVPNPEFEALEAQLEELHERMKTSDPFDDEKVTELEAERTALLDQMANLDSEVIHKPGPTDVPVDQLELAWSDFGYCRVHKELRTKPDACPSFTPREETASP